MWINTLSTVLSIRAKGNNRNKFVNTFLMKFCDLSNIRRVNCKTQLHDCKKRLSFLANDICAFLRKLYDFIEKQGICSEDMNEFHLLMSSGDSLIMLYSDLVIKLFSQNISINERLKNEVIYSQSLAPHNHVVKVLDSLFDSDIAAIAYEKVLPLTKMNLIKYSLVELKMLIRQVVEALDFLNVSGLEHGDPGHSNIAFSSKLNRFILIDLEDIKPKERNQNFDLLRFLEDLVIQLKEDELKRQFVEKILNRSYLWYKTQEEEIVFLGKKKKRTNVISEYQPGFLIHFLDMMD